MAENQTNITERADKVTDYFPSFSTSMLGIHIKTKRRNKNI